MVKEREAKIKKEKTIEELNTTILSLKVDIDDESKALSKLYSEQTVARKYLSSLNSAILQAESKLKKIQVSLFEITKEEVATFEKIENKKKEFKIQKEKYSQELQNIKDNLWNKKEEFDNSLSLLKKDIKNSLTQNRLLSDNLIELTQREIEKRKQIDILDTQIYELRRKFDFDEKEYIRDIKVLERRLKMVEDKLSNQVNKFNGMKDNFNAERQRMRQKRKDLKILAERVKQVYKARKLPPVNFVTDEKT